MFVTVLAVSLFICSSCTISQINPKYNQDNTIINYEIGSKDTNIIPSASETYATTNNYVNWCIYSDGALVINGTNADSYNGHTGIVLNGKVKGTDLNLNKTYKKGQVPWDRYKYYIETVEFAKTSKPISMSCWFSDCSRLKSINSTNLDTSAIENMDSMFKGCSRLSDLAGLSDWDVSAVTSMLHMFDSCSILSDLSSLSDWKFPAVTDMAYMFYNCPCLSDLSALSKWDVSAVTDMMGMFDYCSGLSDLSALSKWDVSAVTDMAYMFYNCSRLSDLAGLSDWDVSAVTNMGSMFYNCSHLTDLNGLSEWDVSAVTSMSWMFYGCSGLSDLAGLSDWDVFVVTHMNCMFYKCSRLSDLTGLSNWDVSTVITMASMFSNCSNLIETHLDNWNPPKNVDTKQMFYNCSQLETIYCKYSWAPNSNSDMFGGCTNLKSDTTGKNYKNGHDSSMANPVTGLFTIQPIGTYIPVIQKTVFDENNHPITDWDFEPDQFTFNISSDDSNAPLPVEIEVSTDDNGQAIWSRIKYYDPGEYIYMIQEEPGSISGFTYDTAPHELKVIVK